MLSSIFLNLVSNMLMLVPIFVTGSILLSLVIFKPFPSWNDQRASFPAGGDDWELP